MAERARQPLVVVIAGPNGAGKTTFARRFLSEASGIVNFVNADLIAAGLSPIKPELAAIAAARLVLKEIDRLANECESFAFESTLSGLAYARRLSKWKRAGYRVEILYLRLSSSRVAWQRVKARVKQGGHDVPRADVPPEPHRHRVCVARRVDQVLAEVVARRRVRVFQRIPAASVKSPSSLKSM